MKNYKLLLAGVMGGAVMLFNLAALADNDRPGVVTVIGLQGRAQYSIDGGHTWTPAVVGKVLAAGSLLRTDDKSVVDVLVGKTSAEETAEFLQHNQRFNPAPNILPRVERNTIRLRPNTTLGIDKLTVSETDSSEVSDAELNLKKGRIFASVKKVDPSSQYFIKIPDGVAAVRGTQIELDTDGSLNSSCSVSSGTVWLTFAAVDANGNPITGSGGVTIPPIQVTIPAGQSYSITQAVMNQVAAAIQTAIQNGTPPAAIPNAISPVVNTILVALPPSVGHHLGERLFRQRHRHRELPPLRLRSRAPPSNSGLLTFNSF